MRDRYNLNLLPQGVTEDMLEYGTTCLHLLNTTREAGSQCVFMELLLDDLSAGCSIPGMGLECVPHMEDKEKTQSLATPIGSAAIPGLDFSMSGDALDDDMRRVRTIFR